MSRSSILISSVGRRVELVELFYQSINQRRLGKTFVYMADSKVSESAACLHQFRSMLRDIKVHRADHPDFIDEILKSCHRFDIKVVIPTIDPELEIFAQNVERAKNNEVTFLVSSLRTCQTCTDKLRFHQELTNKNLMLPSTVMATINNYQRLKSGWPNSHVILKPRRGSATQDFHIILDHNHLASLLEYKGQSPFNESVDYIIQPQIKGKEYTVNCYTTRNGTLNAAVAHERIRVRGGEVEKGQTQPKDAKIIDIANKLNSYFSFRGPWCFQIIIDEHGDAWLIEVNPRFGGGYPLAHEAGVNFTDWIIHEYLIESEDQIPQKSAFFDPPLIFMARADRSFFRRL